MFIDFPGKIAPKKAGSYTACKGLLASLNLAYSNKLFYCLSSNRMQEATEDIKESGNFSRNPQHEEVIATNCCRCQDGFITETERFKQQPTLLF